jgi:hypothetical protein
LDGDGEDGEDGEGERVPEADSSSPGPPCARGGAALSGTVGLAWITGPDNGSGSERSEIALRTTSRTPSQDSATARDVTITHGAT